MQEAGVPRSDRNHVHSNLMNGKAKIFRLSHFPFLLKKSNIINLLVPQVKPGSELEDVLAKRGRSA